MSQNLSSAVVAVGTFRYMTNYSSPEVTILMKYHTLLFSKIRKDVTELVVCCSRFLIHDKLFKPGGYKTFFMLISTVHEISNTHKN